MALSQRLYHYVQKMDFRMLNEGDLICFFDQGGEGEVTVKLLLDGQYVLARACVVCTVVLFTLCQGLGWLFKGGEVRGSALGSMVAWPLLGSHRWLCSQLGADEMEGGCLSLPLV